MSYKPNDDDLKTMSIERTMKPNEPFTALIIAIFSLACYQDGATWTSGFCAAIAGMLFFDWLLAALENRRTDTLLRRQGGEKTDG